MVEVHLETISKHVKDKKFIKNSQHGFLKEKSCLTKLITFYVKMNGLVDKGRAVVVGYPVFSKAFYTVSCNTLIDRLINTGHVSGQ